MKKVVVMFEGEGDSFLLQDTGEYKVSLAFLLEDSLFNYAYYYTASRLIHQEGSINIQDYKIMPINEESSDIPLHAQFEYLLIFYTSPKRAVKYIEDLQKIIEWPITPDILDYHILSEVGGLTGGEVNLLSEDRFVTLNNNEVLKVLELIGNTVRELNNLFKGEEYSLSQEQINNLQTYPIDYICLGDILYEFNYYTGKLKEVMKIPKLMDIKYLNRTTILLIEDELIIHTNGKTKVDKLLGLNIMNNIIHLYGEKDTYQLTPNKYKVTFSKPTSNYYLKKFLLENMDETEDGLQVGEFIIPRRFNKTYNPLHIMKKQHYYNAQNEIVKNYSYLIVTPPL